MTEKLNFQKFRVLTFDCYGTLIDWENGILQAMAPLRSASQRKTTDDEILEQYALAESQVQSGTYKRYRDVLRGVAARMAAFLDVPPEAFDAGALAVSMEFWKPFPDTVGSLRKLGERYQLAIVSNVDDDLFAYSAKRLEIRFDHVITAEQVESYKPSHRNFLAAVERIGVPKEEILHVAQSLYHDIEPANALGLSNVWVNRRVGREGFGATHPAAATPTLEVPDLATLATLAEKSFSP